MDNCRCFSQVEEETNRLNLKTDFAAPLTFLLGGGLLLLAPGCVIVHEPEPIDFGPLARRPLVLVESLEFTPPEPAAEAAPAPPQTIRVPTGWPVEDENRRIISPFGAIRRGRGGRSRSHRGIDIKAARNAPVLCTADGIVKLAAIQRGYGKVVVIDHENGFESAYAHLSTILVKVGQPVRRGDPLGKLGSTGNATGAHIHYEIRREGSCVNPADYLAQ